MNCTVCGTALVPGALFCPTCGSRVAAPSNVGAPTAGLPPTYSDSPPPLTQPYDGSPPPVAASAAPQWVAPSNASYGAPSLPNSTTAVVSLVFGILSWVFLPIIGPIVAIVAGHMARAEIRRSNGQLGGSGMAMAGLVLGYVQLALFVLAICLIGVLVIIGSRVPSS